MDSEFNFADFELEGDEQKTEKIEQNALSETELAFLKMRSMVRLVFDKTEVGNHFAEVFYKQGKILEFMEIDFDEDFVPEFYANSINYYYDVKFRKNFPIFHPCYQDMTDLHLKYFIWWRNELRNGVYHRTTAPYLKLYAYELINGIGGLPPKKTLARLIYIWKKVKEIDTYSDYLMMNLIKSYYCVNDINNLSFEEMLKNTPYVSITEDVRLSENYAEIYELCKSRLPQKTVNNKFSQSVHGHFLGECLPDVFVAVDNLLAESNINARQLILGVPVANYAWEPFKNVPYYTEKPVLNKRVDLSETQWCVCENGKWTSWAVLPNCCCTAFVSYIYRLAESELRRITCFNAKLRPSSKNLLEAIEKTTACWEQYRAIANNEELPRVVETAVSAYLKKVGFAPPQPEKKTRKSSKSKDTNEQIPFVMPKIEFDFTKLDSIRNDSDYLCEKLVIAEEEIENIDENLVENETDNENIDISKSIAQPVLENENSDENEFTALLSKLDSVQLSALTICLNGGETAKQLALLAKSNCTMPSVLIEEINTNSLDIIGDIIIEGGENPVIIEDYIDELRQSIENLTK